MARIWWMMILLTTATTLTLDAKKSESSRDILISLLKKYIDNEEHQVQQLLETENDVVETESRKYENIEHEITEASERQAVDPCGPNRPLVWSTASGNIQSPGYASNKYPDNARCSWKITSPAGKVIKITINEIDVESSNDCAYDNVTIWDVVNQQGYNIGLFCGKTIPLELIRSSGQALYVYFQTDGVDSVGRFSLSWTFVSPPVPPSSITCGNPAVKPDTTSKIVGGKQARPHSWPWQISLRQVIGTKQYHICGGTIISQTVIACAAHCLFDERHNLLTKDQFRIVAGDHDQTTSSDGQTQTMAISNIIYHVNYNPASASSAYDIAVFILSSNLQFNNNVSPICLPFEDVEADSTCYATGWGETQSTGTDTILNQVLLPIVSHTQCRQNNYYGSQIVETMMCAGYPEGKRDACQGDSGGPFVCYNSFTKLWYLQGITSWGAGCAQPKKPGIYTRVTKYLDWIKAKSGVTP